MSVSKAGLSRKLFDAAWVGNLPEVELLIALGTDVNGRDREGRSALHAAAAWGHTEVAQRLIAAEADINARDSEGYTPLHLAARHAEVVRVLMNACPAGSLAAFAGVLDRRGGASGLARSSGFPEIAALIEGARRRGELDANVKTVQRAAGILPEQVEQAL